MGVKCCKCKKGGLLRLVHRGCLHCGHKQFKYIVPKNKMYGLKIVKEMMVIEDEGY